MEIPDAFTAGAIEQTDTNVDGEEETQLREMIKHVYATQEGAHYSQEQENVGVLCFVAGRAYQADLDTINIPMSPQMIQQFLQFLSEGGT